MNKFNFLVLLSIIITHNTFSADTNNTQTQTVVQALQKKLKTNQGKAQRQLNAIQQSIMIIYDQIIEKSIATLCKNEELVFNDINGDMCKDIYDGIDELNTANSELQKIPAQTNMDLTIQELGRTLTRAANNYSILLQKVVINNTINVSKKTTVAPTEAERTCNQAMLKFTRSGLCFSRHYITTVGTTVIEIPKVTVEKTGLRQRKINKS